MKNFLLLFLLFTYSTNYAQTFNWLKKADVPADYYLLGIVPDNQGNIYCFGNAIQYTGLPDTEGSFISKYDQRGNLLYQKVFHTSFYFESMIYVESEQMLITCGSFKGTINPDNISLASNGGIDAFVAGINENGNLSWVTSFGGSEDDEARGLTFDEHTNRILSTGRCKGQILCNSQTQASCDQSMFIAKVSLQGNMDDFKTFDFYQPSPSVENINRGVYINTDPQGNIYVLTDIEGRPWSDNINTNPESGIYVVKLDPSGTELWRTFIISGGCYYGYSYGDLIISPSGNVLIRKRCDGKYGGDGYVVSLNGSTGQQETTYSSPESEYSKICKNNNDLYVTGNENAYGCPCPGNNPGENIFKRMSFDGTVKFRKVFDYGYPVGISTDNRQNIYLFGRYQNDSVKIGGLKISTPSGTYPWFILSCTEPEPTSAASNTYASDIRIYPNPANTGIDINSSVLIDKYEFLNIEGRLVETKVIKPTRTLFIKTDDIPKGTYVVVLYSSETIVRKEKVLLQH